MVTGYNDTPANLEELIAQIQEWDGDVQRVVPVFQPTKGQPMRLIEVIVFVKTDDEPEYDQLWKITSRGWVPVYDEYNNCPGDVAARDSL